MRKAIFTITVVVLFSSCTEKEGTTDNNSRLWYRYPAKYWNSQALHLGNGYFGVSFFGGIDEEVFAISEKSMWTGGPARGNWEKAGVNPGAMKALPLIRKAILDGEYQLADSLVTKNVFGSSELFGNFTSVGNLVIRFLHKDNQPGQYLRELDLSNSTGSVQYEINKIKFRREYFCSYPDRVLAMRFSSGTPTGISFDLKMDIIQDSSMSDISGNRYVVKGYIDNNLRPFNVLIQVKNNGGTVGREGEYLTVRNSNSAEIYLTVATNYAMRYPDYTGSDPSVTTEDIMKNVINSDFEVLKKRHTDDYKSLYDRVTLSIAGNGEAEKLPTNERFERLKTGGHDPGYKTLAFNLGRYMIISSSVTIHCPPICRVSGMLLRQRHGPGTIRVI
jgi:alpha-L-fucosidase 2